MSGLHDIILTKVIIISAIVCVASCGNVFISVTFGEGSHYLSSTSIAEALVKRGHNVTYLIGNSYENRARHPVHSKLFHFEIFNHSVPLEKVRQRFGDIAASAFDTNFNVDLIFTLDRWMEPLVTDCRAALGDSALMARLRDANFDLAIIDVTWGCSILFNAYLDVPTVLFNPLASQYLANEMVGAPFLPAAVPEGVLGTPQRMSFLQRLRSLLLGLLFKHVTIGYFVNIYDPLRHEFGILEDRKILEYLDTNIELVLSNSDPVIDLVLPNTPAVIEVGGLLTKPSIPLEKDLDDFVNGSGDDGVIVLSLGTYVRVMPQRLNDLFASVFARLPQRVVWQLPDDSPTKLSPNVRTMGWLPQNDLLGHPKTKLFIYQGGNNGLYEALYHGVPVIVLPVFADQLCVAARVKEKGMGLSIDIHSFKAEDLENAIRTVLSNETFSRNAKRLSKIYHHRPETPAQRAAFWVEHVMEHGGKYMRMPSKDLNFFQLYLYDVMAFLFFCFVVFLLISFMVCRCMCRCCRNSASYVFVRKDKRE